ncbi:MAG: 1-acyl-sn-glycerol-3-phosphate acyltransferase [Pseudomonadota bacterium]
MPASPFGDTLILRDGNNLTMNAPEAPEPPTTATLASRSSDLWRRLVDRALGETHDHYACILPSPPGKIAGILLKTVYKGIRIPASQAAVLTAIPKEAVVVYAVKNKSRFEYLFYHTRLREFQAPVPEIAFEYRIFSYQPFVRLLQIALAKTDYFLRHRRLPDPYANGYFNARLTDGTAGVFFLVEKEGFYRRFVKSKPDPIRYLVTLQRQLDRPVYIVPLLMLFGKNPARTAPSLVDILFGTELEPGLIRRWATLLRRPEKILVEVSAPFNLQSQLADLSGSEHTEEQVAIEVRRRLLAQFNRHLTSIVGPVVKSREELKESILTSGRLRQFMKEYAETENTPIYEVRKDAAGYLDEISANQHLAMIRIFDVGVRWLLNTMFDGLTLDQEGLDRAKHLSQKAPLILVPCHKSHIDYLILSYVLFNNNMHCPLIAAGKNLSFWPLGPLFRSGGAFFIRRTFKGQQLYSKVFAEYIYRVLQDGNNLEFFIEGGRSRTGKMILPKLGLLSIIIDAFKNGACDDLILTPVYIGYDRVLEESAYLHELEGGKKESENLKQVIKARRFLKKRYGRVYIKFNEPISFRDFLNRMDSPLDAIPPTAEAALIRNLGHRIISAINWVSVVTPHAVVAGALLNTHKKRISHEHLLFHIETYLKYLDRMGATLADTLVIDADGAIQQVLDTYVQRKFIERFELGKDDEEENRVYAVVENKRPNLEYYKNNCIAFFVTPAFTALAILLRDAFQFDATDLVEDYLFFQDLFKNEFAYDTDHPPEHFVRQAIAMFVDDAVLMPHPSMPDTYNMTSQGFRKLRLVAGFLTTYFESYRITLSFFKETPRKNVAPKDRLKKIETIGNRMYKNEEIEKKEALSKVYYKNASDFFISRGVAGSEDIALIDTFDERIQRALQVLLT